MLALELVLARLRQPPQQHHRAQLRELELPDPREHQVGRRRVELDPRQQHGQHADRRLHQAGREPRVASATLFPFVDILEGGHGLHLVRLRAVHAEQRAALQDLPAAGQLHLVPRQARVHLRRRPASSYHSENVFFPGSQSVYVYNSLADFYTDANDYLANPNRTISPVTLRTLPGALEQHPRAGEADPAARRAGTRGVYAQDEWQRQQQPQGRPTACASTCRSSATPATTNADADALTFRDEDGNPVQYQTAQAAGRQHPLVAARRLQLGRDRRPHDAGARRHGRLHRPAGLRLDLQPDRQHRRAHRLRAARQHDGAAVQPEPGRLQARQRDRRAGARATSWRSPTRTSSSRRSGARNIAVDQRLPWGLDRHRPSSSTTGRQRHLLHQRQPAGGRRRRLRRRRRRARAGRAATASTRTSPTPSS